MQGDRALAAVCSQGRLEERATGVPVPWASRRIVGWVEADRPVAGLVHDGFRGSVWRATVRRLCEEQLGVACAFRQRPVAE